jgi:hypothetical protein
MSRVASFGHVEAFTDDGSLTAYCDDFREELKSYVQFVVYEPQSGQELPHTLVGSMTRDVGAVAAQQGLGFDSLFGEAEEL